MNKTSLIEELIEWIESSTETSAYVIRDKAKELLERYNTDWTAEASTDGTFDIIKQQDQRILRLEKENYRLRSTVEFYENGCGREGCKDKIPHVH
jgi:hypothetical protein